MADRIDKIPECLCSNAGLPAGFTSALSFDEQVQWLLNAYNNLLSMIPDNMEFNGVKFIPQALTENEKNIARENIGAGTSEITQQDIDNTVNNNTISYKIQQNLSAGQKELARKNIGAGTSNANYAVEYVNQNLTEQQKEDARRNIGAASEKLNGAVLTTPQALTENEKFTARNNIGIAYGFGDIPVLYNQIQLYPETYKAQARNNIGCPSESYFRMFKKTANVDDWETVGSDKLYCYCKIVKNPEFIYTYESLMVNAETRYLAWVDDKGTYHLPAEIAFTDITYTDTIFDDGERYIAARILASRKPTKKTYMETKIFVTPINDFPADWLEIQTTPSTFDPPIIKTERNE